MDNESWRATVSRVARELQPVLPSRTAAAGATPRVSLVRAAAVAMAVGGVLTLFCLYFVVQGNGWDTYSYWRPPHVGPDLYSGTTTPDGLGQYRYAPVFAQVVSVLWGLPWEAFI